MENSGEDWSRAEVEATVAAYFAMLSLELQGIPYNKSQYRRDLKLLLQDRTDSAIERKHMNISAVLIDMDAPHIDGYKPYTNYQRSLLPEVVEGQLAGNQALSILFGELVDAPAEIPPIDDILRLLVDPPDPPELYDRIRERQPRPPRKTNFLGREALNRRLGEAGEKFVLDFERARLIAANRESLASKIEHVSKTQGDGAGFDILSYDITGRERLVEVKTTRSGKHTPFFVSANEVAVSRREIERYQVYRVFSFVTAPRLFIRRGAIDEGFLLTPEQFIARVS